MIVDSQFVSEIVASLVGAFVAYLFALLLLKIQSDSEARKLKEDRAFAFSDESTGPDFARIKLNADRIFKTHKDAGSLDDFFDDLPEEDRRTVNSVLSFYRRLHLAIEYGRIDTKMVLALLPKEFIWWYYTWLDRMVPEGWETRERIDGLRDWIQDSMPESGYRRLKDEVMLGQRMDTSGSALS
jgi:hypothetical protein